ncbi:hypothetical protein Y1Q_0024489 [Alligator mississippiensis]|uniref:Uncharacterized protein n=1 Tax=Alligator mississippiensis TaxID=8496 RepID=A0A151NAM0_ALLMI|nr:hypothetical protein Y1Q_0024489 [Alligator mississippiensis]
MEVAKEWEVWVEAWWEENITQEIAQEDVRDQAGWEIWAKLLTLEQKQIDLVRQQVAIQAQAVEATNDNCQILDTLLGLVVMCASPTAPSLSMTPQGPLYLPNTLQQAPTWAWEEVS